MKKKKILRAVERFLDTWNEDDQMDFEKIIRSRISQPKADKIIRRLDKDVLAMMSFCEENGKTNF